MNGFQWSCQHFLFIVNPQERPFYGYQYCTGTQREHQKNFKTHDSPSGERLKPNVFHDEYPYTYATVELTPRKNSSFIKLFIKANYKDTLLNVLRNKGKHMKYIYLDQLKD